jgi:ABC-type antimicrobial peptide transport system permease subunit
LFVINLIGLTTALACCLLIYLWIVDEMTVDKYLDKNKPLYQVLEHTTTPNGIQTTKQTPQALEERITEEFPEVETATVATPVNWFPKFVLSVNESVVKAQGKFSGKDFFNTFNYELVNGVPGDALTSPNAIVISQSLAGKLFKDPATAMGKTIDWKIPGMKGITIVTGVFKDVPSTSSEKFDLVLSFDILRSKLNLDMKTFDYGPSTFLKLREDTDVESFNEKLSSFIKRKDPAQANRKLFITKYSDQFLYGSYENGVQSGGRISYVQLFGLIAIFVLTIACINFMNLATAKATSDLKGVGVRKIVGAKRSTLIGQFLTESLAMSFLSLGFAVVIVLLLLEPFSLLTGKNLQLHIHLLFPFATVAALTGLIAGIYPSLYLSWFNPLAFLKGRITSSTSELTLRKGLVVFQFVVSTVFIVGVAVVYKQVEFIQNKNLGFDKENIIVFDPGPGNMSSVDGLITELQNTPGVENASSMWGNLITGFNNENVQWEGSQIPFASMNVNYDFMETMGFKITEGRTFSRDFGSDENAIILNKKAVDALGIKDPLNSVINFQGQHLKIIGITENFHFQSLYSVVMPLVIRFQKDRSWTIVARISRGMEKETLSRIEKVYSKHNDGLAFEYHFLDHDFQQHYAAERRIAILSKYFASLAIIISALGLFGLASFTAERKRKEIGIRKVLGANISDIVILLTVDFFLLVLIALFIGSPLGYWLSNTWLSNFAYHIDLNPMYFILSGAVAVVIVCMSVGAQAFRASQANPLESLKQE